MSKFVLRHAKNSAKYSVQWVAALEERKCQNFSFATRKILQSLVFNVLLLERNLNIKIFSSLRAK